ncbi:MAG: AMP-dependent synthetase/ligase [Alphaproteobacteria bacterium]
MDLSDFRAIGNLASMFFDRASSRGDAPFLWAKQDDVFRPHSWRSVASRTARLAQSLREQGIRRGDRVVIGSENRPEWAIADLAILTVGAIPVPVYTTFTVGDHRHVLADSGAVAAVVSNAALTKRIAEAAQDTDCRLLISMANGAPRNEAEVLDWDALATENGDIDQARAWAAESVRSDTSCIIYTSGTGGKPKGVMLSHGAILCNIMGAYDLLAEIGLEDEVFLSFLPLSHSYEHAAGLHFPVSIGAQVYYAEGIDKLAGNMVEARPTIMTAVPRLYETMRGRIMRGVEKAGGLKATLFNRAVEIGSKRYHDPKSLSLFDRLLDPLLDRMVRDKVRARFGGRLKAFVSGGAPLNPDVGIFFLALGVRVLQGYGQTESGPVVSCNRPSRIKMHTVGPAFPDVEVKIAADGEILVRGELVMQGYWNIPELTAETVRDGWLHTGDIGHIDEDGFIQITDRKKDIIVNSGGDNISPQRVEGVLCLRPEILQAMVYGDKRAYLVALIVPDPDWAKAWASAHGKSGEVAALKDDPAFRAALMEAVRASDAELSVIERVRQIALADEPFTIDNQILTPSLKMKRHVLRELYGPRLEALYKRKGGEE